MKKYVVLLLLILFTCKTCQNTISKKTNTEDLFVLLNRIIETYKTDDLQGIRVLLAEYPEKNSVEYYNELGKYYKLIGDFMLSKEILKKGDNEVFDFLNTINMFDYARAKKIWKRKIIKYSNLSQVGHIGIVLVLHDGIKENILNDELKRRYQLISNYARTGNINNIKYLDILTIQNRTKISPAEMFIYNFMKEPIKYNEEMKIFLNIEILSQSDMFFYYTFISESDKCLEMLEDIPQYNQPVIIRKIRNKIFEEKYDEAMKMIFENKDRYPDNKTFGYYENLIEQRIEKEKGK